MIPLLIHQKMTAEGGSAKPHAMKLRMAVCLQVNE